MLPRDLESTWGCHVRVHATWVHILQVLHVWNPPVEPTLGRFGTPKTRCSHAYDVLSLRAFCLAPLRALCRIEEGVERLGLPPGKKVPGEPVAYNYGLL